MPKKNEQHNPNEDQNDHESNAEIMQDEPHCEDNHKEEGDENKVAKSASPEIQLDIVIADGKALKLSPKTCNHVFYEVGVNRDEQALYIRLTGNEGGGLHSKGWIAFDDIFEILDECHKQQCIIKSTLLNPVFIGGSQNNAGFMAAVLRSDDIGLLRKTEKGIFTHQTTIQYEDNKALLLAYVDGHK